MKNLENKLLCAALVFFAAFIGYANSISPVFHWEDEYLVEGNVHIRSIRNLPVFFNPGYVNVYESGQGRRYRPLRTVTLAADYALWRTDPRGYHLTNVLLNSAVAVVFWYVCLGLTGNPLLALLGGVLFAVHPVHAESVAWIKNRSDILCALFYFASMGLFVISKRRGGLFPAAASAFAAVPAFFAKEMAVTLPFALCLSLIYINLEEGKDWKEGWAGLLPSVAMVAAYFVFRGVYMPGGLGGGDGLALWPRISLMSVSAGEYIRVLVLPLHLSLDRILPSGAAALPDYAISLLFLASGPLLWFYGHRRGTFWLLLFWVLYVPVSNLSVIEGRPFAEQRMYMPSAAFCAFLAWAFAGVLKDSARRWRIFALLAVAALVLFWAARGIIRNADWKSEVTLWQKTVADSPSPRAYNNLAVSLLREKRYDEAVRSAGESLKLNPAFVDAYDTLGAVYHDLGLLDKSIAAFERAAFFSNGLDRNVLMNLATAYSLKERYGDALVIYRRVVQTAPWADAAYYNMGLTLMKMKRYDEAAGAFSEALALNPYDGRIPLMLARTALARGDKAGALAAYSGVLRLDPGNQEAGAYLALSGR